MKRILDSHKGREIPVPGPPEYSCVELIISRCVKKWKDPMEECLDGVINLFKEELETSRTLYHITH